MWIILIKWLNWYSLWYLMHVGVEKSQQNVRNLRNQTISDIQMQKMYRNYVRQMESRTHMQC